MNKTKNSQAMNLLLLAILIVTMSCNSVKNKGDYNNINWIPFLWKPSIVDKDTIKYGSMEVQGKIKGLDKKVGFQFDLGSTISVIYEVPFKQIVKDSIQFPFEVDWTKKGKFSGVEAYNIKNFFIESGSYTFKNLTAGILKNYGDADDSVIPHVGTIGLDAVANKYVILDYKNQKIGITDSLSQNMSKKIEFIKFEETKIKQTVIKIDINNKKYNVLFDTGSSNWNLVTGEDKFNKLLGNSKIITDSINVASWGKEEFFYESPVKSSVAIAGKKFENVHAYYFKENATSKYLYDNDITAIIGNRLFLNKIIVIDYRNKRFGIFK